MSYQMVVNNVNLKTVIIVKSLNDSKTQCGSPKPEVDGHDTTEEQEFSETYGGAVWDIFRRGGCALISSGVRAKALAKAFACRMILCLCKIFFIPFTIKRSHKRQLKAEYGIEPWTFEQACGEAVFIPAGCPHQVGNPKGTEVRHQTNTSHITKSQTVLPHFNSRYFPSYTSRAMCGKNCC